MSNYIGTNIFGSIAGLSSTLNNTVDKVSTIAHGAFCIASNAIDLILNPAALLTTTKDIILGVIQAEISTLTGLFVQEVNTLIGIALNPVISILRQITGAINFIQDVQYSLEERIKRLLDFNNARQNCAAQAADFARCLQGQISAMVTNKTIAAINKKTETVNSTVIQLQSNFFNETNLFKDYADKTSRRLDKANIQLIKVNNKLPF